ncbi:ATP synthase subunit O, mitochondrial-like [Octopus vulgaris]|uniref:ATP synthase peripheral stalk subunit OSCP, mitochondrial n=2 Tax=Octopus vulgaris TaxID=6645 RepID=A0AA36B3F8_OCTVU|nr:ATP synthase subunit O, mitochondrial-like [Octopus vulgaris]
MASLKFVQPVRQFATSSLRLKLVKPPVQVFGIAGRYATALYSAATKENKLDLVQKDLTALKGLMAKDVSFAQFIENPSLKRKDKETALVGVAQKMKYNNLVVNLLGALSENGRIQKISGVIDAFEIIMSSHRGEVPCTVTTAKALDAATLKELQAALQLFLNKKEKLILETKVDPTIIGGMLVNIGDRFVDMSMATKIRTYTNLIKQAV